MPARESRGRDSATFQPIVALRRVVDDVELPMRAKAIGAALVRRADDHGRSWPSLSRLAKDAACGRSTVIRALSELEAAGYIEINRRTGGSSVYQFRDGTGPHLVPVSNLDGVSPEVERGESRDGTGVVPPQDPKIPTKTPKKVPKKTPKGEAGFSEFWSAYPKKVGKRDAAKAWEQVAGERPSTTALVAKVRQFSATPQWTKSAGQFIPHPATWLRRGGWDDEIPETPDRERAMKREKETSAW